jgi:general secretion pathway protein A
MYKAFYHLSRNPFELTPDPSCFVPTKRHDEALASLYYGVRRRKGLVVVTGEVGTGKTLLLRCLLRLLEQSKDIAYAYLFNSTLSPTEFLQYTLADFGFQSSGKNKCELLLDLSKFLVARGTNQLTTVLIVDEAHQLSAETLEEIRLLSNLETPDAKLLQIMLVGQPELDEKLDSVSLRQLKQRIAFRTQLGPLSLDEAKAYIEKRLQIAGADPAAVALFSPQAVARIHRFSHGYPRLINTICENALITAYARRLPVVPADIIEEVASEFRLEAFSVPDPDAAKGRDRNDLLPAKYQNDRLNSLSAESRRETRIALQENEYEPDI